MNRRVYASLRKRYVPRRVGKGLVPRMSFQQSNSCAYRRTDKRINSQVLTPSEGGELPPSKANGMVQLALLPLFFPGGGKLLLFSPGIQPNPQLISRVRTAPWGEYKGYGRDTLMIIGRPEVYRHKGPYFNHMIMPLTLIRKQNDYQKKAEALRKRLLSLLSW